MAFDPDHSHGAHPHGTGIRIVDLIVGLSAMFISIVSLVVSIEHGETMKRMVDQNERMVAASTTPFLTIIGQQVDESSHKPMLSLVLRNGGVGPAVIDVFQIRYKGVAMRSPGALLRACCASALKANGGAPRDLIYSNISGTVLPSRESVEPIRLGDASDPALRAALEAARGEIDFRACYCSVLNECWQTDLSPGRPRKVSECRAPKGESLW